MFKTIKNKLPQDKDLPARAFEIDVLTKFLNGEFYDHLQYAFCEERNNSDEYIPILKRQPSVRAEIAKIVVDQSVSLLFDDGHFPEIECDDDELRETLKNIINECNLKELFIEAATIGSVGSVAVLLRIFSNRLFFEAVNTAYLTPVYNPEEPDTLIKVIEQYKIRGKDLIEAGYEEIDENQKYWMKRIFDLENEWRYLPFPVNPEDENAKPQIDLARSTEHKLGFVPIVWIRNLPNGNKIDGGCTFKAAIETNIELDYQLSQCGRGLRYTSDPTLLIKDPAAGNNQSIIKGANNALVVDENGDAKYLEIDGGAATAVLEYAKVLREIALENIHGNRANADKVSAAQSGVSQKLMFQSLIWLSSRLRITYGNGLIQLLNLVCKASQVFEINLKKQKLFKLNTAETLTLKWPDWFPPTPDDKQKTANTLKTLDDSGHMSQATAVEIVCEQYDIQSAETELAEIVKQQEAEAELEKPTVTEMKAI